MGTPLPNVNRLVADVLARAKADTEAAQTKQAAAPQTLTVPIALGLEKLAQQLRHAAEVPVTYDDVQKFAAGLMEHVR
jgi:hypothetical protein